MERPADDSIRHLLHAARGGDANAASDLLPIFYRELRKLAQDLLRRRPAGETLQATALVHEAYLRIVGRGKEDWDGRRQFFATASRAMQDILVEAARRKAAIKRGGGRTRVPLESELVSVDTPIEELLQIDDVLEKLDAYDAGKGELIRLRVFAGLTVEECAHILGVSRATIERELRFVRAWIARERLRL